MWTEEDEKTWRDLTTKREQHKDEVGRLHTIKTLREMADALERGENLPSNIAVEYIRDDAVYAFDGIPPVIGKKIILTYYNQN